MTVKGPDLSSFQGGLTLVAGTPFVLAKATEGTTYRDSYYAVFKSQAAVAGALFSAYHFLHAGNVATQAQFAHSVAGSTPLMLDVEATGSSKPQLADVEAFIDAYRAAGGNIWAVYLPRWYWQGDMGSPSLIALNARQVALIASNYTAYSDTGPGWASYGGVSPALWQYSESQPYGGKLVDFNAYRGTKDQLAQLMSGAVAPASNGGTVVVTEDEDGDMHFDLPLNVPKTLVPKSAVTAGGSSVLLLTCDYGDVAVRVATFSYKTSSWSVQTAAVKAAGGAYKITLTSDVNKVSLERTAGDPGWPASADVYTA